MTLMRARKAMIYDGRDLIAGEVFDCLAHDVPVLVQAGLADPVHEDNPTGGYVKTRRGRYRRRDLKAEE